MISWPEPNLPPINLYNAPKANNMRLQSSSANNIVIGKGIILGAVNPSNGQKAWALPGGLYTFDRECAEKVARFVNRMVSRHL